MPSVYLASPLGFAASTEPYRRIVIDAALSAGLTPLDPWNDPGGRIARRLRAAERVPTVAERHAVLSAIDLDLGERNRRMIEECAGVLAVLDGVDVDSGTAAEIGFAAGLGKPVVGLRTDTRLTGDNAGCAVNLQVEYFIRSSGGAVFTSLPRAVAALARLVRRRRTPP
jgi:nucleoside 2-deoxyribosyltransferase